MHYFKDTHLKTLNVRGDTTRGTLKNHRVNLVNFSLLNITTPLVYSSCRTPSARLEGEQNEATHAKELRHVNAR